ncbi:cytochrome P450 [Xylaria venustula]|nr:cytochrome P450 [Xylaria venustula]
MSRLGAHYWGSRCRLPIYTLRLPFARLYVVNSPQLVQTLQRRTRTISFAPIMVRMASTIMGLSTHAVEVIGEKHLDDHGFIHQFTQNLRATLNPGPKLDTLNRKSVQIIAASLDKLSRSKTPLKLNMVDWIYKEVMIATTEGVYGPHNPFKEPTVQEAFFIYEHGFVRLMVNILPTLSARKSVQARNILEGAYLRYYAESGHTDPESSALIQAKHSFGSAKGIKDIDIAKMEVTSSIALLSNTMPATFWLVYHIYSDAKLLDACRLELARAIRERDEIRSIDMVCVKNECPLLLSTFQEVLRFYGIGISTRLVLEDTMIDNQFLVKKGGIVLIPGAGLHKLRSAWGEQADQFCARRFMQDSGKKGRGYDPVAFRAFGGGTTLCPGRHFAATEILAFASLIILRFNAQPTGNGEWRPPTTEKTALGTTIRQPDYGIEIELQAHDDCKWAVHFSNSDKPMPVSAEDIVSDQSPTAY